MDAIKTDVGYEFLFHKVEGQSSLVHYTSSDGQTLVNPTTVMEGRGSGYWDYKLYRSSLVKVNNRYRIYYSGVSELSEWRIGLSISEVDNDLTSLRGVDSDEQFNEELITNVGVDLNTTNTFLRKVRPFLPFVSGTTAEKKV